MLTRTEKRVKVKGRASAIVREQYLREDIPCNSPLCETCVIPEYSKVISLDKEANHYIIPCYDIIENYLDILESPELKGLIFLQSITSRISQEYGLRKANRILNISKDPRKGSIVFLNEINKKTYVPRRACECLEEWLDKCSVTAAEFYADHLNGVIPIILVTNNINAYKHLLMHDDVRLCNFKDYLVSTHKEEVLLIQQFESLSLTISSGSVKDLSQSYENYLPMDVLLAGIKANRYLKGYLRVNKHNASEEAFVTSSRTTLKDSGDVFISGMINRNRAIHGDEVVIEILPENMWKTRSLKLVDNSGDPKGESSEENGAELSQTLPTGKVVGVLDKCWRNYVATLPEEEETNSTRSKDRFLVVPYDYRIPKIRIATRQSESLRNKRIIVRIDSWEKDSQYPCGHLVQALGEIGDLETEVKTLLVENDAFVGEFPASVLSELPVCPEESPWTLEAKELTRRKDLRSSHLVFSIDPKGCEDVDDALSVRDLPNGGLELGVHIADVTYFVKSQSLTDLEARRRSTSIYLPDRRYDMLPHLLSGNLCSLLGNVDRYAVSVLWEFNSKCQVQNVWYGRTIIKSKYKLCYEAAQEILQGATVEDIMKDVSELQGLKEDELEIKFQELRNATTKLFNIANIIRSQRLGAGGLELNSINMKFEIDQSLPSPVTDVKSSKELPIHKTVAECMIFANHWVAKKICEEFPHQAVLRRHPYPRDADLAELQKLAESKGFTLNTHSNKELAESLENAVDGKDPSVNLIFRILATQTMNQAKYCCTGSVSLADLYHYGLGLDKYTHFTSPIRRYSDVMVHRILLAAVENSENIKWNSSEIEEMCNHMNMKHKAAQDLEKDAQQLFLAFFFEELSSKDNSPIFADAVIYALRQNGMLVFVPKYGLKGAVCLCNKNKQVAVVKETVEWVEGKLTSDNSSLLVEAGGMKQRYSIFKHVTVCIKVQTSRSHLPRILLDLVNDKPYIKDWTELPCSSKDMLPSKPEMNDSDKENQDNIEGVKNDKFNLYLFLQRIRALTLKDSTAE